MFYMYFDIFKELWIVFLGGYRIGSFEAVALCGDLQAMGGDEQVGNGVQRDARCTR